MDENKSSKLINGKEISNTIQDKKSLIDPNKIKHNESHYLKLYNLRHFPTLKSIEILCRILITSSDKFAQSMSASSLIKIVNIHPKFSKIIEKRILSMNIYDAFSDNTRIQRILQVLAEVGTDLSLAILGQEIIYQTNPVINYWLSDAISRIRARERNKKIPYHKKILNMIIKLVPNKLQLKYFTAMMIALIITLTVLRFLPEVRGVLLNLFLVIASLTVFLSGIEVTNSLMEWMQRIIDILIPMIGHKLKVLGDKHPKLLKQIRKIPKIGRIITSFIGTKDFARKIEKTALRFFAFPMLLYIILLLDQLDESLSQISLFLNIHLEIPFNIHIDVPWLVFYYILIKQNWFILLSFSSFVISIAKSGKRGYLPALYGRYENRQPSIVLLFLGLFAGISIAVISTSTNKPLLDAIQIISYFITGFVITVFAIITAILQIITRYRMNLLNSSVIYLYDIPATKDRVFVTSTQQFGEIHVFVFEKSKCTFRETFTKNYLLKPEKLVGIVIVRKHKQFFDTIVQSEGFYVPERDTEYLFFNSGPGVYIDYVKEDGTVISGGDYGNWWWNRIDGIDYDTMYFCKK